MPGRIKCISRSAFVSLPGIVAFPNTKNILCAISLKIDASLPTKELASPNEVVETVPCQLKRLQLSHREMEVAPSCRRLLLVLL